MKRVLFILSLALLSNINICAQPARDYVPPTPVFDGYYTLTGVYQSGGQWFSTGIATLTYFRVYEDEMYEGKGTYAYRYAGNERLDNTVFRTTVFEGEPYLEVLGQMYGSLYNQYNIYR